jgi:hypothetical protein
MIIKQNPTQSTGSRTARRIALAGGAAAIAAVAFSGAASAAPLVNNTHSFTGPFGNTLTRSTQVIATHNTFTAGSSVSTTTPGGTTRGIGGGIQIAYNPVHPLQSTFVVGGSVVKTTTGPNTYNVTTVQLGVQGGHIVPPVTNIHS